MSTAYVIRSRTITAKNKQPESSYFSNFSQRLKKNNLIDYLEQKF